MCAIEQILNFIWAILSSTSLMATYGISDRCSAKDGVEFRVGKPFNSRQDPIDCKLELSVISRQRTNFNNRVGDSCHAR